MLIAKRVLSGLGSVRGRLVAARRRAGVGERPGASRCRSGSAPGARSGVWHNALGVATATRGEFDEGVAHLRQALAVAEEVQSAPATSATAYVNLSHVLERWPAGSTTSSTVGREGMLAGSGRVGA